MWLRPLHHVAGAVLVLFLPALRDSPRVTLLLPQDVETRAAFSLLSLLPSQAPSLFPCWPPPVAFPSSFFVRWPPLLFSLPLCLLVCCLVPVASPRVVGVGVVLVFWWGCSYLPCLLSFCWWFGGLIGCLLTEVTKDY